MYVKNDLFKIYLSSSGMVKDYFEVKKIKNLNFTLNVCESWNSFIDIGTSDGFVSELLIKKGFENGVAVEVDFNKELAERANQYNNLIILSEYIQNIEFKKTFDLAVMRDLFEHIPLSEMKGFCKKVSSIQTQGGVVYMLTPNPFYCGPAEFFKLCL